MLGRKNFNFPDERWLLICTVWLSIWSGLKQYSKGENFHVKTNSAFGKENYAS
jgi:hypothetical protein